MSSIVNAEHGMGVGMGHIAFPQGHMYIIMLVHGDGWLINVSPKVKVGKKFVSTVALSGLIVPVSIIGNGGHQQVNSFILIV
jgi:hypothetical protein